MFYGAEVAAVRPPESLPPSPRTSIGMRWVVRRFGASFARGSGVERDDARVG
jgi:hypothetical protein